MTSVGTSRLKKDYLKIKKDPIPYINAEPLFTNIFEWHYVIEGPKDSDYEGGFYHGYLIFAPEYPFKAPSIYMITPNGRFECLSRLCLSMSDFHQESWNPSWCVGTILTGLLSFMLEEAPTFGSISSSKSTRKQFARDSLEFNLKNVNFKKLFPQITKRMEKILADRKKIEVEGSLIFSPIETSKVNVPGSTDGLERMNGMFGGLAFLIIPIILCALMGFFVFNDSYGVG